MDATQTEKRILVVDDDSDTCELIGDMLSTVKPYHVDIFTDSVRALKQVRANPNYDVIISDMRMPGMDGLTFVREAKTIEPRVPVIMLTACGSVEGVRHAKDSGVSEFLGK